MCFFLAHCFSNPHEKCMGHMERCQRGCLYCKDAFSPLASHFNACFASSNGSSVCLNYDLEFFSMMHYVYMKELHGESMHMLCNWGTVMFFGDYILLKLYFDAFLSC